jgi:hypothetical protein
MALGSSNDGRQSNDPAPPELNDAQRQLLMDLVDAFLFENRFVAPQQIGRREIEVSAMLKRPGLTPLVERLHETCEKNRELFCNAPLSGEARIQARIFLHTVALELYKQPIPALGPGQASRPPSGPEKQTSAKPGLMNMIRASIHDLFLSAAEPPPAGKSSPTADRAAEPGGKPPQPAPAAPMTRQAPPIGTPLSAPPPHAAVQGAASPPTRSFPKPAPAPPQNGPSPLAPKPAPPQNGPSPLAPKPAPQIPPQTAPLQPKNDVSGPQAVQLGGWLWKPTPEPGKEPDPHDEFASSGGSLSQGLRFVAARARGKKHKYDGTHCDDWYEASRAGPWSLIAVADGAGSKRISRVGAKEATTAAIAHLKTALANVPAPTMRTGDEWRSAAQARDPAGRLTHPALGPAQEALVGSMRAAQAAVAAACEKRKSDGSWDKELQRAPELKDLRSTLLVTIVCPLPDFEGGKRALCLSSQIGDGLTVAFQPGNDPAALAARDAGEYSSETEFLTDFNKWDALPAKTGVAVVPLRMLASMTDGVDDIYDPRTGRNYNWLLCELLLNRVLPFGRPAAAVDAAVAKAGGPTAIEGAVRAATQERKKRLMGPPEQEIEIMDVGEYANALNSTVEGLLAQPELILAAHRYSRPVSDDLSEEKRLLAWVDGKDVRAESDDRTIVLVLPELGSVL